jgi:putative spermidine/putrescine transport system ATP-binding protein
LQVAAPAGFVAGQPVLLSVRPEQLTLSADGGPQCWRIEPGLSLPLGAQLVHEARTADGVFLKIVEPRRPVPPPAGRIHCALTPDARPSLFPRTT